MKRKLFLVISFFILAIFLVSCSNNGGLTPPITSNQSPTASFTADPTTGVAPLEVSFDASNSSDSDGNITSYAWDFKDGETGNGETISHTFNSIGSYNVELTVIDDKGATDSITIIVNVTETLNQLPTASFTANPTSGVVPLEVAFNASSSSDSDGNIISYAWDFKDGNTGTGQTINHTFNSIGSYNVELTVIDNKGAIDSSTNTIIVTEIPNQLPTASFTVNPISVVALVEVSFDASSSSDSDGTIISYTWNFGDGSNGSGVITNNIYENAGDYTVQLTVSDNDSASDSITMDIEVISGTIADGIISSNTTWTIDNSPYIIINEDLQIAQNVTLSIEEGVIVKANPGKKIKVAGNLNTNGSEGLPVKFTSLGSSKWRGIEFIDSPNSNINNTIIENAEQAINLEDTSLVNFVGNVFRYNEWAVTDNGGYQKMHFLNNTFLNNEEVFYGIRTSGTENRFENNIFIDNNNVFSFGYYFGQTVITNNNFLNNNFIIRAPEIGYGYGTVDMLNNWWGTTDTSIIDSYIEDGNDDVTLQTLNYNPIKNSEISSIGSPISVE